MRHGFFFGDVAFLIQAHEVAMHGNMFERAFETVWNGGTACSRLGAQKSSAVRSRRERF